MSRVSLWGWIVVSFWAGTMGAAEARVSFTKQIKPILAAKCFACHGPDEEERKAELRLDVRAEAVLSAIIPGKGKDSEVVQRITTGDADLVMPPADAKKPAITAEEAQLIERWIDEGAEFDAHWAYVVPQRPAIPTVKQREWPANAIDHFVLAKLEQAGLTPAPEAETATLARRLSFDVLGLPAAPEELARLKTEGYEAFVDRLLASRHFGERMAMYWLDVVRYADTGGYHSDNHREVWAYRDYVIEAFNRNKPFDQFTIEQLAGDLLPGATEEQRIASGFNRLLQTTEEGGAQPKEYAAKYAADRVRNTAAIWLASTMGCCECHTHKFDPFTIKDFYRFAAFFADVSEKAVGRQEQTKLPTPEQAAALQELDEALAAAKAALNVDTEELRASREKWEAIAREQPPQGLAAPALAALKAEAGKRTKKQDELVDAEFRKQAPELAAERKKVKQLEQARAAVDAQVLSTLVSMAVEPRVTRVLARGNWLDDTGDVVSPGYPAAFVSHLATGTSLRPDAAGQESAEARLTRLDLARWIVSRENPLTARVYVNRLWKLAFGRGISKSLEDFGSQGELPTHPDLLDWLATELVDSGWDTKHVLKLMLLSRSYRQSSLPSAAALAKDPTNELLSRQNRFRLDAEMIRDGALATSGLLVERIGGPSVKPYQPAGYWQYLNFPKREWENDQGEGLYRRGLYTYWQRTFLHPSLAAFDASSREECTVDRPRTSTPQQALVLLNDPTYVEAARALAVRLIQEGGDSTNERLQFAFEQVLLRGPREEEVAVLAPLVEKHRREFAADPAAAEKLLAIGDHKSPQAIEPVELATWTSVCRVLLNLHEAITRN